MCSDNLVLSRTLILSLILNFFVFKQFTIAVVMMALAVSAQASIVPLAYSLPYAAAPYQYAAAPYQYSPLAYTSRSLPLQYAPAIQYNYEYAPALRAYPDIQTYAELRSPATIIPVAAEG